MPYPRHTIFDCETLLTNVHLPAWTSWPAAVRRWCQFLRCGTRSRTTLEDRRPSVAAMALHAHTNTHTYTTHTPHKHTGDTLWLVMTSFRKEKEKKQITNYCSFVGTIGNRKISDKNSKWNWLGTPSLMKGGEGLKRWKEQVETTIEKIQERCRKKGNRKQTKHTSSELLLCSLTALSKCSICKGFRRITYFWFELFLEVSW